MASGLKQDGGSGALDAHGELYQGNIAMVFLPGYN